MHPNARLRTLSFIVIIYMLLAFSWWSILLFTKNKEAYLNKVELLRAQMIAQSVYPGPEAFPLEEAHKLLETKYQRQTWMIAGEVAVFSITLLVGLWLINRGYFREMHAARQQRNFLLSITHELKSPIASVQLALQTIQKRPLQPAQLEKICASALRENERLHNLVSDLLLSARLESAYTPNHEPVQLDELLKEIITQMRQRSPNAHITLSANELPPIQADRSGLHSVFYNLLENSIKYSPEPAQVHIRFLRQPDSVVVEIADQGIGIPPEVQPHIFDKFYRAGNEDTRKTKGTGLGLYIVQQIVQAHNGQVRMHSNEPKGSVFSVTLPT
jgi:two-component system phosphate regulon sensor histidine kinase PhoR